MPRIEVPNHGAMVPVGVLVRLLQNLYKFRSDILVIFATVVEDAADAGEESEGCRELFWICIIEQELVVLMQDGMTEETVRTERGAYGNWGWE